MSLTSAGRRNLIIGPVHMEAVEHGEVRYFTSSHATPGTRGEVQNAITRSLSTRINKKTNVNFLFIFFVCFHEAAFRFNDVVADTTSV